MSESARITRILERQRQLQIAAAIRGAKVCGCDAPLNNLAPSATVESGCCDPTPERGPVYPESYDIALKADVITWGQADGPFPDAVAIRGTLPTSESARIKVLLDSSRPTTANGCGYIQLGPRFIAPGCPPIPTAILNGSLPKPSTRNLDCAVTRFEGTVTPCSE